jgi:hypothetical protein
MRTITNKTHDFVPTQCECNKRADLAPQVNAHNRVAIFDAITAVGARTVVARFSGGDNQVNIDRVNAYAGANGKQKIKLRSTPVTIQIIDGGKKIKNRTETLESAIGSVCFEYLEQECSSWLDENVRGTLTFDAADMTITLDCNGWFEFGDTYEF